MTALIAVQVIASAVTLTWVFDPKRIAARREARGTRVGA